MTLTALILVTLLHAVACLGAWQQGNMPIATMLGGFTIADLGMIWAAWPK
jgi:hypothetical protein